MTCSLKYVVVCLSLSLGSIIYVMVSFFFWQDHHFVKKMQAPPVSYNLRPRVFLVWRLMWVLLQDAFLIRLTRSTGSPASQNPGEESRNSIVIGPTTY
ncbi:hypothetical protein BV22DRAFT_356528 [Leucogyrophana mollusca]|uniref:Uncharacterized protein n=1 Tax=Leucogyrophana mollusca TaxID=85980 RepID=A0ACB8BNF8_9AGAM|nr:hypothetical protein BV22DRAFT_356528 [Leucogyrophana mollusca]